MKSKICKCGNDIPTKRIELGFNDCVECSTTETYGTVDITYHKTGNTVQHVDKATAKNINKAARRNTYGSNLGSIKPGGHEEFRRKIDIGCSTATIGSQGMFERVTSEVELKYDLLGKAKAIDYINRKVDSCTITVVQSQKLKRMLDLLDMIES